MKNTKLLQTELYRYVDGFSSNGEPMLVVYYIIRLTPKGYYISQSNPNDNSSNSDLLFDIYKEKDKWVPNKARRPFAYTNKDQALYSYFRRKIVHENILTAQVSRLQAKISKIRKFLHRTMDDNGKYIENHDLFLQAEDMEI